MSTTEEMISDNQNELIRRVLWVLGAIMAVGIGIAGFSIASGLFVVA